MQSAGAAVLELSGDAAGPVARTDLRSRLGALLELTKPGITRLVVITAAAGFYLASAGGVDVVLLLHTLFGTALAASGSGALNQYMERGPDARMRRTARRPLPTGRLTPAQALLFATGLAVAGVAYLYVFVGARATGLVAASLLSYLFVYTPLKQRTWLATPVGAVPGALPILAGWAAAGGPLDGRAWALFGILFFWQMPHFFALAWIYREDYVRGGFRMLTAEDATGSRTSRQIISHTALLLVVSLLPSLFGLTGRLYLAGATVLGGAFLALGMALALQRTDQRAWRLFFGSVAYLPALLLLMVFDKVAG
jgi:protoheme IX farnesyltransferase